jgi:hypothetical protein
MEAEELDRRRRNYAEKIISGEYKSLVVCMVNDSDEEDLNYFYDGSRISALGLVEHAKFLLLNEPPSSIEEDEDDE